MGEQALREEHLDVYDTRHGRPWNPEHGEVTIPKGWEFVPSGDAFVTRTVKSAGTYWVSWRPRGRGRPHRRLLGLWAPAGVIRQAEDAAADTAAARARRREQGVRRRAHEEERYREELAAAILAFLAFAPVHADLATQIARSAATHAADVGSGRVGRARTLSLEERAALAARAWIRHHLTDYEDRLDWPDGEDFLLDELAYRDIRHQASQDVDDFLTAHRPG